MRDFTFPAGTQRLLLETELRPLQGDRFQSTGFPDIGGAVYQSGGHRMLLVESAQSVANRLESVCLANDGVNICDELKGLPYVLTELKQEGSSQFTSSLVEAHRLNSPYILGDKKFQGNLIKEMGFKPKDEGRGQPNWQQIHLAIFKYDPSSLLHGIFFSNIGDGRIRVPRAVSGFVEAADIVEVNSGGVKNDRIDPSGKTVVEGIKEGNFGNVPFPRTEYTAKKITAFFNFDLSLVRGFGLSEDSEDLLISLALFKISKFIGAGLRLRAACDLRVANGIIVTEPSGFILPGRDELLSDVQKKIKVCREAGLFAGSPTHLSVDTKKTKDAEKKKKGRNIDSADTTTNTNEGGSD